MSTVIASSLLITAVTKSCNKHREFYKDLQVASCLPLPPPSSSSSNSRLSQSGGSKFSPLVGIEQEPSSLQPFMGSRFTSLSLTHTHARTHTHICIYSPILYLYHSFFHCCRHAFFCFLFYTAVSVLLFNAAIRLQEICAATIKVRTVSSRDAETARFQNRNKELCL